MRKISLHLKKTDNNHPIIDDNDYYYNFTVDLINDNKVYQIVGNKKIIVGKHLEEIKDYETYQIEFKIYFNKLKANDRLIISLYINDSSNEVFFNDEVVGEITNKVINISNIDVLIKDNKVLEPVKDAIKGLIMSKF